MRYGLLSALLISTSMATALAAGGAAAQTTETTNDGLLSEVVVTATRTEDTVNRVPLSITAVTQTGIEQLGVKNIQDLARTVPALQITPGNVANGANVSIRGVYSTIGTSTTAVYLDDVPLQRRTTLGTFSGSGVIFPQLFDLERVEVLRGPQGSLYGGSAQGGAIRFITPTPSLTSYDLYARGELSDTKDGDLNHEIGLAVGGPIVADKLAFRASAILRRESGYIDHVDIYSGRIIGENTNGDDRSAYRAVLLWQATDRLSFNAAAYTSREHHKDADSFWENIPAVVVPTRSFSATGAAVTPGSPSAFYTLPGHTYGPYDMFGPYRTGANCNIGENYQNVIHPCYGGAPRTSGLTTASLSADYDLGQTLVHFTSGFVSDRNKGALDSSYGETAQYQGGVPFHYNFPLFYGKPVYKNERNGMTEELRVTSNALANLSLVGGAFYSYQRSRSQSHDYTNEKDIALALRGLPDVIVFGAPVAPDGDITARDQKLKEVEMAVFGQGDYTLGRVKLTAGGRLTKSRFSYRTNIKGSFFGYNEPTVANGGLSSGIQSETQFAPKFGAQYMFSADDNIYATAAKGFRVGGVNTGPYFFKCAPVFASLGITDTPREYGSDSLWSYELGAKTRTLGGRAQINVSAFYIKWSNVQVNYTLPTPCGFSYTTNAGGAVSKGGDVQAQFRLLDGLTASVNAAYTDAYYTDALVGPAPTNATFINKGDTLPVPKVTMNLGLRYDFMAFDRPVYLRGDYQYAGPYKRGFGPGASSFNIDTYQAEATNYFSARAGIEVRDVELSVFVNNLFNSQEVLSLTGGRACSNADCSVFRSNNPVHAVTTFRPRTIGMTLAYRR